MKLKPIHEQVVVLMGATSGIGLATAHELARQGARVVIGGRDQAAVDNAVNEIRAIGGEATGVYVEDVANFDQVRAAADQAAQTYGRIDTWVHLAGVSLYSRFEDTKPDEFRRLLEVNLLGQIYGALAALPYLKREGRGALIHVSSVEAKRSLPFQAAYAASKRGIPGFLDSLRLELQEEGVPISVTNIMPAGINTPLFNKALTRIGVTPRGVPPVYSPEVVAKAILYAATHPVRDMYAGGAGRQLGMLQKFAPAAGDRVARMVGFRGQRTEMPESPGSPHNLYQHMPGYDQVRGEVGQGEKSYSMMTWMRTHSLARNLLAAAAVLTGGFFLGKRYMDRSHLTTQEMMARAGKQIRQVGHELTPRQLAGHMKTFGGTAGTAITHAPGQVAHRVSQMRMPGRRGLVQFRRQVGPVVLPGHIGPITLRGHAGPVSLPVRMTRDGGRVPMPEMAGRSGVMSAAAVPVVMAALTAIGTWAILRR